MTDVSEKPLKLPCSLWAQAPRPRAPRSSNLRDLPGHLLPGSPVGPSFSAPLLAAAHPQATTPVGCPAILRLCLPSRFLRDASHCTGTLQAGDCPICISSPGLCPALQSEMPVQQVLCPMTVALAQTTKHPAASHGPPSPGPSSFAQLGVTGS